MTQNAEQYTCSNCRTDNTGYVRTHSVHKQEVCGIFSLTYFLRNTCSHRNSRYTGTSYKRIDLTACSEAHKLSEQNTASRSETEGYQTEGNNSECFRSKEKRTACRCTDCSSKEYRNDIHEFILSSLCDSVNDTAFFKEIAEHEHTDKGSCIGKKNCNKHYNNDWENNFFEF